MQLCQKRKMLAQFFFEFCRFTFNFEHFQKRMTLIADVFLILRTLKDVDDKCLKSRTSGEPSTSNMVNGPKHC